MLAATLIVSLFAGCATTSTPAAQPPAGTTQAAQPSAATAPAEQEDTSDLVFALVGPLTGNAAEYGAFFEAAVGVRVDEINSTGGVNGKRKVVVDAFDDKNNATEGTKCAQLIVNDEKYLGVVGPFASGVALAMAPIYDKEKMAMITPTGVAYDIIGANKYTFGISMPIFIDGPIMAGLTVEKLGGKNIAIVHGQNDNGIAYRDAFIEKIESMNGQYGCKVLKTDAFLESTVGDYTPLLVNLKALDGLDTVLMNGNYPEVGTMIVQAQQVGLTNVQWAGTQQIFCSSMLDLIKDVKAEVYAFTVYDPQSEKPAVKDFMEKYTAKLGKASEDGYGANAYDAMSMFIYAAEQGADTREEITDELLKLKTWSGVSRDLEIREDRFPISEGYMTAQAIDGKWVILD